MLVDKDSAQHICKVLKNLNADVAKLLFNQIHR
jgi:hypothetical protein